MALWLQLETGKTKKYVTYYALGQDELNLNDLRTKCEIKFNRGPQPHEGCNHIDCAIEAAEYNSKNRKADAKLFFAIGIFWLFSGVILFKDLNFALVMCGFCFLMAIWSLLKSHIQLKNKEELIEYRDYGTIGGVGVLTYDESL